MNALEKENDEIRRQHSQHEELRHQQSEHGTRVPQPPMQNNIEESCEILATRNIPKVIGFYMYIMFNISY